jgi:EmrB/QacA subfamily drug resistance transporter
MDALVTPSMLLPAQRGLGHGGRVADARDETQIGAGPDRREGTRGVGPPNRWTVLALVALGTFMTTLDTSIVNISLPSIARTFQTPIGGAVEWVIIAYLTVVAATLLTFGRLSDAIGRKPVWEAGLATFTLGSVLCGAAGTLPMLIIARAFQGLGGALIFAPSFAIITEAFSPVDRGRALGLNSVVIAIATSLGPTLGGMITAHLTWRWIFYVNVPVGVLGLFAARRLLPASTTRSREPLDGRGATLLGVGLACLSLSLSLGQEWGWASVRLLACVAAAVAALGGAVLVERRTPHPIVDFGLFRNRMLTSSLVSMTLAMLALFAITFILPFYFEQLRGFSVEESGFLLTPLPLTIMVIAPLSGSLADRFGSRWLATTGLALACLGLFWLSRLDTDSTVGEIVGCLVLTGLGQGIFQSPNTRAFMSAAPGNARGEASGLMTTGRVVGQSLSVAVAGAIFTGLGGAAAGRALAVAASTVPVAASEIVALQHAFLAGFRAALTVAAGLAAVGILAALVRGDEGRSNHPALQINSSPGPSEEL